jgi:endonuclease/exonuclease/phosphatase family metal-dependent hydrolase
MSYKEKYIKYKNKYTNLKNEYIYGGKLSYSVIGNLNNFGTKFSKDDYDKKTKKDQNNFPFYCDDDNPILCSIESSNFGLCKKNVFNCIKYSGENTYPIYDLSEPIRKERLEYGKQFNYKLYENKDKNCSTLVENSNGSYEGSFIIPKKFKIITYNCWWSLKVTGDTTKDEFHKEFFKIRIDNIAKIINESEADIICLQEVGELTFKILEPLLKNNYPYYYEIPFNVDKDDKGLRSRSVDTLCFSRFQAKGFKLFSVQGNLHYNNSMLMLEFDNLIIFNVYLQAGTRNSPGQKDLWFNYSRCRYNEYLAIGRYLKDNKINKPIVVLGDFNTNLNGTIDEWPELKAFKQLNLQDSWLEKYDNNGGFTEDTSINLMRWNVKFEEKIYRIDGIFYTKDKLKTSNIKILGNIPIDIDKDMQQKFKDIRIPEIPKKDELIRKNGDQIQLWPSDHFAVLAELELI